MVPAPAKVGALGLGRYSKNHTIANTTPEKPCEHGCAVTQDVIVAPVTIWRNFRSHNLLFEATSRPASVVTTPSVVTFRIVELPP